MAVVKFLTIFILGSLLTLAVIKFGVFNSQKSLKMQFFYPPETSSTIEARLNSGLSCESVTSTVLLINKEKSRKTIESEIMEGTDKLSVRINGESLYFLTRAALETGATEGDAFSVIQNTDKYITAIAPKEFGGIDTFVLNKKTEKAIWSKTNAIYFGEDVENQSMLLHCF